MAQGVVDELETVDVEEQDGKDMVLAPAGDPDSAVQAILEQSSVGKLREAVKKGVPQELLFGLLPHGDVRQGPRDPVGFAFPVPDGESAGQRPPVGTVAVAQAMLELEVGGVALEMRLDLGLQSLALLGMDAPEPFLGRRSNLMLLVAQHRLPAGRDVDLGPPQVPIPKPVVGPPHGECVPLFTLTEG